MNSNIFVISDTHFSHNNILTFKDEKENLIRPGFSSIEDMNELIIYNINKTLKPNDILYHLGDFCFGNWKNIAKLAPRLICRKRLILGNHDYEAKYYYPHFEKVMSWRQFGEYKIPLYLCHYPLDEAAFNYRHVVTRKPGINIHGHLHNNLTDKPYHVNVCVEHTNYMPVALEDIADGKYRTNKITGKN